MSYKITEYSKRRARELGVDIKPSTEKGKKIDVFKDGKKIVSIGDLKYGDYPTYIQRYGKDYADNRRMLYKMRHKKNTGLAGYYASKILW